jgi:hypothetical protein
VLAAIVCAFLLGQSMLVSAQPGPFGCVGNHDPGGRPLACHRSEAAQIRRAVGRFCRAARGTQRSHCRQIRPLLGSCRCPIDLHAGDEPPYAWLGLDHRHDYMWLVELKGRPGKWSIIRIAFDDLERP